jgi:hypothetical protein
MSKNQSPPGYSVGGAAAHFDHRVAPWQIRRVIERGLFPEPARIGPYRIFAPDQLPLLREALVQAGYLPRETAAGAAR